MPTAWEVVYKDGTNLYQFNDNEKEKRFLDIEQERLNEFRLFHNNKVLSLFIDTGTFGINGFLHDTDISNIPNVKYRLIYFIRKQRDLSTDDGHPEIIAGRDYPHIGFQVVIDGKNHQRMIKIDKDSISFVKK